MLASQNVVQAEHEGVPAKLALIVADRLLH